MIPVVLSPLQEEIALGRAKEKARKRQREAREEIERETKKLKRSRNSWLFTGYTYNYTDINVPQVQQEPSSREVQKVRKYKPTSIRQYLVECNSDQQKKPRLHPCPEVGKSAHKPLNQRLIIT